MALYQNKTTGEIRDLDDALIAAWQAAGNPKADQWVPYVAPPEPPPEPPVPPADWTGFAGWLFQFPPMYAGMEAARASSAPQGEPCTTALPAAMDEARLRGNYHPFTLSWGQFLAASGLAPEAVAAIVARAQQCHLPEPFIQALGGASA